MVNDTLTDIAEASSKITGLNDITLNLIAAIATLILGLLIGRFLSNLVKKLLHELELDRILKEKARIKLPLTQLITSIIKYIIYGIAILLALNQLGLRSFILNAILTIIVVLLVVFMMLSLKDFIPNFTGGLFLYQKRSINPGDVIKINNIEGEILNITLLETKLRTKNNEIVYIPNSVLTKNVVVKKSKR